MRLNVIVVYLEIWFFCSFVHLNGFFFFVFFFFFFLNYDLHLLIFFNFCITAAHTGKLKMKLEE
jgi:hypothetical protein